MMDAVLGQLNREFLINLLTRSFPTCRSIRMAVAYAERYDPVLRHIQQHPEVKLTFYGRMDHEEAVSLSLLEWFLEKAPATVSCQLINGHYHPKVISWDGWGAYIGSANLTRNGWERNVEAGVFLTNDELEEQGIGEELEHLFDHLDDISLQLTNELHAKLKKVAEERKRLDPHLKAVRAKYDQLLGQEKPYAGLITIPAKGTRISKAQQKFVDEWRNTLQLMRTLSREFEAMQKRPPWVPESANPTVHFDQFLHGYYYHYIEATHGSGGAAVKVEEAHQRNRADPARAFREAADWWASLAEPPTSSSYEEERFIKERAPRMHELLAENKLPTLTADELTEAFSHSHAFREHARHFTKAAGLAAGEHEPEDQQISRLTQTIWAARTKSGRTVVEVLHFLIYGTDPSDAEHRLWMATKNPEWRLPHLGRSILGELIGWARPDDYPPRNNRNNMALRALGHERVELF